MNPSQGSVPAHRIEVHVDRTMVLPGRVWCAERPRALIAVCHGIGEHSGRYAAFASALVASHYSVVALDLPGHGEAKGARGDAPSWTMLRDHVVPAMFTATRGLPDQPLKLPHVLFGHSMGGVLALDFALAHARAVIGVAVSAPGLKSALPPWWKLALANVARSTAPSAGFPTGLDESAMSRDAQVLRLRKSDPLMHDKISPRLYFEFNEARQRVVRNARRLQVPTLIQHGAADAVTDPRGSLELNAAAPHGMVRLITYKDAYHELFNDPAREEALKDLRGWLELAVVM